MNRLLKFNVSEYTISDNQMRDGCWLDKKLN